MKSFEEALRQVAGLGHILPADVILSRALSAGAAESTTVPTGAKLCRISCTAALFFKYDREAATVNADETAGNASVYVGIGEHRFFAVEGGKTVSVISDANSIVTLEYYA